MPRSKFSAAVYVVLIFLSGALVGATSYRLYSLKTVTSTPPRAQRSPEEWRQRYVDDIRTHVNLNEEQVTRLQKILDETRASFKEFHDRTESQVQAIQSQQVEGIRAMLSDAQKPLYDQWRQDREKRRRQSGRKK